MGKIFKGILNYKKTVIAVFMVLTGICAILSTSVGVNYNILDYLPKDAQSTNALEVMKTEFGTEIPNARLMVKDISVSEAISLKKEIASVAGVNEITWLDDSYDTTIPLEMSDQYMIEEYYKDGNALFSITVKEGEQTTTLTSIRSLLDAKEYESSFDGAAVNTAETMQNASKETTQTTFIVVIICFVILLLTTTSWFEPVLFMSAIGVAIVLNRGTNIIFGEISFVTNSAAILLQLAVSMDYSIFLLHQFADNRHKGMDTITAMQEALKSAFPTILASGLTTVIGFAALILMRFEIGPDMGWVMAKSIVLSMLSVMIFLPALAIVSYKLIDKTHHKPLFTKFDWMGKSIMKIKPIVLLIFILILVPSYLAQMNNAFYYGTSHMFTEGQLVEERNDIEAVFGKSNQFVILVEKGNIPKERALSNDLHKMPEINSVISYVDMVGEGVPTSYIDNDILSKLSSENYSRMLITIKSDYEGKEVFQLIDKIEETVSSHYDSNYYLAGESVNTYDLKGIVESDMVKVNLVAIGAVFIVLLFTLKSIILPFILVLTIESAVWLNTAIPYFGNEALFYIVYLIVTTIQLGATVDYAILFTTRYLNERSVKPKKSALHDTVCGTALSILTSACILTFGALTLGIISENAMLGQLGVLIGRGAVLSTVFVLVVLPALLYYLDKVIEKTTKGVHFEKGDKKE